MTFRSTVTLLACAFSAAAQDDRALDGRDFAPAEHRLAAFADVGALVESELWDALERSPARMLLEHFRDTFGFGLDEVTRFEAAVAFPPSVESSRERQSVVLVLQGSERVGLDAIDRSRVGTSYELTRAGGLDVLTGNEPAIVSPRPGELVFGDSHHVLGILEGRIRGGVPTPDLMPLIAGGKSLAWFACLADQPGHEAAAGPEHSVLGFVADWFDAGDPLRHVAARLVQRPDDGHLVLTARVGFASGTTGPAVLLEKIDGALAAAAADPALRLLQPVLDRLATRVDGHELWAELDLGEEETAVGTLVQAVVLTLVPRLQAARQAQAAAAARELEVQRMVERIRKASERAREELEGAKGEGK